MKIQRSFAVALLALAAPLAALAGGGLHLVGVEEQTRAEPSAPLVSGRAATLEILIPPGEDLAKLRPRLRQLAGAISAELPAEMTILPSAAIPDNRVARVRLVPPAVGRVTRLGLWLGEFGPVALTVFPAADKREDIAPLAEALDASRLRLAVCGRSAELRDYLRSQSLEFDDLGPDAPDRLPADTVLLGELLAEDWERLSGPRETGRLIAFVDEPALLPGVYSQPDASARRRFAKVTLPLAPLLATDPRARETLHRLLLDFLPAAPR